MKISDHITYAEAIHSNTAKRKGIDNTPSEIQVTAMKLLAEKVFEPLRKWVGGPIKVNSFFRSEVLNESIGGATTSQHCKGQAIDIDDVYGRKTNADMYHWIQTNLDYDQMIWEFGTDMQPNWIHVSYVSEEKNRNKCLKAYKEHGRTKYKVISS
jgi:zinc D-Ala-D-Ala carboxypeptidase